MPLTKAVIQQVHKIAEIDKMPRGLKIQIWANIVLFDSAKTAGVNYDDTFDDDNTYKQNSGKESDKEE